MDYMVYIKRDNGNNEYEYIPWSKEGSFIDAVREVEYLRRYEGLDAKVK